MPQPLIPDLNQVLVSALSITGVSTGVLVFILTAFAVQSWYDGLRQVVSGARMAGDAGRRAATALSRMKRFRAAVVVVVTIAVPVGQALAIGLCFLGGNYLSLAFNSDRQHQLAAMAGSDPTVLLRPDRLAQILTVDPISAGYGMLAAVIVVKSYSWATHAHPGSDRLSNAAMVMAFPAVILLGLAAAAAMVMCVILLFTLVITMLFDSGGVGAFLQHSLRNAIPLIVGASICALYWGACHAAVRGSQVLVNAYRTPSAGTVL